MNQLNLTSAKLFFTSTLGPPPSISALGSQVPVGLMSLCFLVGFPGNLAVLILRPNWPQLSRLTQALMLNLALSDLLCLATLPVWIYDALYDWTLGVITCKIVTFLVYCSIYSSILTITALSAQRYMQVVHPQRSLQFKKRLLVLMWLMSMVLSIPMFIVRQITEVTQEKICCAPKYSSHAQHLAVLLSECFFGISSFTITMCAYIVLNRKLKQTTFFNNPSTFKFVTIVIVIFFVLWTPYLVFDLVIVGGILSNNQEIVLFYYSGFNMFAGLTFISSSINPLLYAFAGGLCQKKRNLQQNQIIHNTTTSTTIL